MSTRRRLRTAILPLVFGLAGPSAFAQEAINTPIFNLPVTNFRDIAGVAQQFGGSGYAYDVAYNGTMRTGIFYRSNALGGMNAADQAIINKLGIKLDIDLRTPNEISKDPDIVPAGANYVNINVIGTNAVGSLGNSAASVIAYMQQLNVNFVSIASERSAIGTVLLDLANANGAALYHCTAGKDRTGWVTAILDSIAGLSSADTMANYLATNAYSATLIKEEMQQYGAASAIIAPALGVQASFLQAGLNQVATEYGSMKNYLIQGLGLTQADIYVLRAKMVYYNLLPGEAGLQGNAASGASFLQALQNSPLSGHYTAFNYYLQSAIDAGTLSGVQNSVGGQIYADTASALSRSALQTNQLIAPYTSATTLTPGQGRIWATALGDYAHNQGGNGNADDVERMAGGMIGITDRLNEKAALNAGFGYGTGTISSAGAGNTLDSYSLTAGGRYGFSSLQQGYYMAAQANYEYANLRARRALGNGLGTASGHTNANVYSGTLALGNRFQAGESELSPQIGVYAAHVDIAGFTETDSELALQNAALKHSLTALTFELPVSLPTSHYQSWEVSPTLTASYARILGSPTTRSTGSLDGYSISQDSAFHSPNLFGLNGGLTASDGAWSIQANAGSQFTSNGGSGFDGHLSLAYKF